MPLSNAYVQDKRKHLLRSDTQTEGNMFGSCPFLLCLPSLCTVAGRDRSCHDGTSVSLQERKVTESKCHKADNEKVGRNRETDRKRENYDDLIFQQVQACQYVHHVKEWRIKVMK